MAEVAPLARQHGINVALGAWIGPDPTSNEEEIQRLIGAAKSNYQNVVRVIVGNEAILRAEVSALIADTGVDVILTTGSTGLTGRDVAPEALEPLFDKVIEGFGELFRAASVADIGAATIQSRAFAGLANGTIIFCMPGSPGACRTAWEEVIRPQLDARTRPCNLANLMPRFLEQ